MNNNLYIGLMSGTSLDGVDAVLVSIYDDQCEMMEHHFSPIPTDLKAELQGACQEEKRSIKDFATLDHRLGCLYADTVLTLLDKACINAKAVKAIGNHGQTLFHHPQQPYPYTVQLGDANIIAVRTGIKTIADFRRKDMALGGQGAPLVPAFHRYLFKETNNTLNVVLNIGGISNVSIIEANNKVTGFDTGPGNTLLDVWCQKHTGLPYDADAAFAKKGSVNLQLLQQMLNDPYFEKVAPKSTGREYFHLDWLQAQCRAIGLPDIKPEDIQATLVALTVESIALHLDSMMNLSQIKNLYVCGGGVHNPLVMQGLKTRLTQWCVTSTQELGISPDYMEAIAFAWLAYRRVNNLPSNIPQVTGASREASLGVIYLAD